MDTIPVTIITGFLGAGKTTLLNHVLSTAHGRRFAVIVNEFAELGIDQALIEGAAGEVVELSNGCICCTEQGDLRRALQTALARDDMDAILIETTGLADPGPIAQLLLSDAALAGTRLEAITTVVDASNVTRSLAEHAEARAQLRIADHIVLNKADLVSVEALRAAGAEIGRLNPLATVHLTTRAKAPLDALCGRRIEEVAEVPHSHNRGDHSVGSVSIQMTQPLDGAAVSQWLDRVVTGGDGGILRAKGLLSVAGEDRRIIFHAVGSTLAGELGRAWSLDEPRHSRLVFIGRDLDDLALRAGALDCVSPDGPVTPSPSIPGAPA